MIDDDEFGSVALCGRRPSKSVEDKPQRYLCLCHSTFVIQDFRRLKSALSFLRHQLQAEARSMGRKLLTF